MQFNGSDYLKLENRIKFLEEQNRHLLELLATYEIKRPIQVVVDAKEAQRMLEIKKQLDR